MIEMANVTIHFWGILEDLFIKSEFLMMNKNSDINPAIKKKKKFYLNLHPQSVQKLLPLPPDTLSILYFGQNLKQIAIKTYWNNSFSLLLMLRSNIFFYYYFFFLGMK